MIRTIITPEKQDISIHVPKDYVGKQIEVLMYNLEEINQNTTSNKKQPSEFRGQLNLSDEQYNDLQSHIKSIRNEWDRNI